MDLDEQVAEWTAHSAAALDDVVAFALRNRERILRASLARLRGGFGQYGDAMFRADDSDSERDLVEELADAVNYRVSRRARGVG